VQAQSSAREDEKELLAEKERLKFKADMQNLMDAASKSGFSEKEIREITVTRNGKVVHVWDFLEQEKLQQKKDALANKRSKPLERYLTVMDIAEEMESGETKDLDSLKDKSIFVGAEEK
jgi:AraC-like DNA-binding protein